jgi:hypothetical protein
VPPVHKAGAVGVPPKQAVGLHPPDFVKPDNQIAKAEFKELWQVYEQAETVLSDGL